MYFQSRLITFSGHTLTSHGITTDQNNIKAINNTQTPTNTSQIYKIIFGYNKLLSSIYCQLLNHNRTFETTQKFHRLTKKLTSAEILSYYNPIAETNIKVDTGPKGLGAILSQKQKNGR